ncbi:DNA repair protein XRCC2 homolog isoform X1 [Papaver somniferum]|uniref:DNA repair protein XRCC2 homolog isoform X1 n=1 Tax=Papaver somniferum TaxID=3469 RepID=UPI000E7032CA|nr:DNA repair protein XRCC2 homolog isoform X1 [Papaver somniferum]
MATPAEWINGDESAKEMLYRVLTERPFLLIPPIHRVPLRVGNVVEIVGPSPSAKTQILMQAAITSILPKEWKGVHYGGLERKVLYFDLDCRFDVERLAQLLRHHILSANRPSNKISTEMNENPQEHDDTKDQTANYDEELFLACMKRFLYVRCYNSFEFLATLKTLRYRLQKESKGKSVAAHFLMIDSIGAFYWADRASTPLPVGGDNRKSLSLQSVVETVVKEIQKLLLVQPMLLLATKATILGGGDFKRSFGRAPQDASDFRTTRSSQNHSYREYMPSVWQDNGLGNCDLKSLLLTSDSCSCLLHIGYSYKFQMMILLTADIKMLQHMRVNGCFRHSVSLKSFA